MTQRYCLIAIQICKYVNWKILYKILFLLRLKLDLFRNKNKIIYSFLSINFLHLGIAENFVKKNLIWRRDFTLNTKLFWLISRGPWGEWGPEGRPRPCINRETWPGIQSPLWTVSDNIFCMSMAIAKTKQFLSSCMSVESTRASG